jgi:hypothetical protein
MKTYGIWTYIFTILDLSKLAVSSLGRFSPREIAPDFHWIGRLGGGGIRACLDAVEQEKLYTFSLSQIEYRPFNP